jgi:hypothetical protein
MHALLKTLVLLLLAAVVTAPLAAQGLRPEVSSHERPAGCHEDGGNVPAPGPASHSCCEAGHDFALLPQSSTLPLPLQLPPQVDFMPHSVAVSGPGIFLNFAIVSGDPPIPLPLRV